MENLIKVKKRDTHTNNLNRNRKKMQYHLDKITDLQIELNLHEEKLLEYMRLEGELGFKSMGQNRSF